VGELLGIQECTVEPLRHGLKDGVTKERKREAQDKRLCDEWNHPENACHP
jgi:hypothetical protein